MPDYRRTHRLGLAAPLAGRDGGVSPNDHGSDPTSAARRAPQAGRLNQWGRIARHCADHTVIAALFGLLVLAPFARAEHFQFDLTIDNGHEKAHGFADDDPPAMGRKPREVIHVKKGEPFVFQFFMTSNFPHDAIKNVGVLYFIVPEEKPGQTTLPPLGNGTILQGHFTMDFKPTTGRVGVRQQLRIDKPGVCLVRVESENSASDHEHFAAIDVIVE